MIACSAAGVVEKIVNKFTNDTPGGADVTDGDGIRFRNSSCTAACTADKGTDLSAYRQTFRRVLGVPARTPAAVRRYEIA